MTASGAYDTSKLVGKIQNLTSNFKPNTDQDCDEFLLWLINRLGDFEEKFSILSADGQLENFIRVPVEDISSMSDFIQGKLKDAIMKPSILGVQLSRVEFG
jgi:hypothetical protein